MKGIEKQMIRAVNNRFDLKGTVMYQTEEDYHLNLYVLVFGTDFLDKLVNNVYHCGYYLDRTCSFTTLGRRINTCDKYSPCLTDIECRFYESIKAADQHRAKLANMTLDEMITYISKL